MTAHSDIEPISPLQREPGDSRPVEPGIARRALLTGMGATLTSAALAAAIVPALSAEPTAAVDAETDGLTGLTLAAVHIERAIAAMAPVKFGNWSVTIRSGKPDQYWGFNQEFNMVLRAISLHKRADVALGEALDHLEVARLKMQAHPAYDHRPKVQVGKYVAMAGEPERAIYAYDVATIERHSEQWQGLDKAMRRPVEADARKAMFARQRDDLERQIRRQKRIERQAGVSRADKAVSAAYRAEEGAAMAVILSRPANPAEAAQKRSYMRGKISFKVSYWDVEALFAALMDQAVVS